MAPQRLDDRLGRDDPAPRHQQHGQHRARLRAPDVDGRAVRAHLEVAKQPELHATSSARPASWGNGHSPTSTGKARGSIAASPARAERVTPDHPGDPWKHRGMATTAAPATPATADELALVDAWWRAANYLSVGQIYLLANPLLRRPLTLDHVKPRLLGHWGTTPGLNLVYAHMNRIIRSRDLDAIYVCGPGHGGPGMVANTYLEGTYSEIYPDIGQDEDGLRMLFRQFSFPGGIPSHAAPETPGSINEGGELGYALAHAYGAALRQPRPGGGVRGRRRRGRDGCAGRQLALQQVPRPGDRRGRAADPPPQRLQDRQPHRAGPDHRRRAGQPARGLRPHRAHGGGRPPGLVHRDLAGTLDAALDEIAAAQRAWRHEGDTTGLAGP